MTSLGKDGVLADGDHQRLIQDCSSYTEIRSEKEDILYELHDQLKLCTFLAIFTFFDVRYTRHHPDRAYERAILMIG